MNLTATIIHTRYNVHYTDVKAENYKHTGLVQTTGVYLGPDSQKNLRKNPKFITSFS